MSASFDHPLLLLLLLVLLALPVGLDRRAAPAARSSRLGVLLAMAAMALVVVAVAGPQVRSGPRQPTTLVVDESASVSADMRKTELRWTRVARGSDCTACPIVRFGSPHKGDADGSAAGGRAGTDLGSALTTAIAQTPRGGRIVVLSDGAQTSGDMRDRAGIARARGVQIDWAPLRDTLRRDAAITAIQVPPVVQVGDSLPVSLTVHSTVAADARLLVRRNDGRVGSEVIRLKAGDNPLVLRYTASTQGWNSFEADIALAGDTEVANDRAWAVVKVARAPRVLVVTGRSGSAVAALLSGHRMTVRTIDPGELPSSSEAYAREDAVVLDDVSATQLTGSQAAALVGAVRGGGLGLLVLGGPHSFSAGRYWNSPLQQILPVRSFKPGKLKRRDLALQLVLDRSSSMRNRAGGVSKIDMVKAAAVQASSFIAEHHDELGIVAFDVAPDTLVSMQRLAPGESKRKVDAEIAALQTSGGTAIFAGLQAGFSQLLGSRAPKRHLILMTDGISGNADYATLEALLRRERISVATVALGDGADRRLLARIARATGGHAYVTDDAKDLQKIFLKETRMNARPVRVEGNVPVTLSANSPIVGSLAGRQLPVLTGNVVVALKEGAQADLQAGTEKKHQTSPALAQWQIGAGRVVTWTPGLGAWGRAWLQRSSLFNDAVRWSKRGVADAALVPEQSKTVPGSLEVNLAGTDGAAAGPSRISGTLTGRDGVSHRVVFTPAGVDLYRADISTLPAGAYRFALTAHGGPMLSGAGMVAVPYPAEYSPVPAHTSPLGQLVAQTGGHVLTAEDPGVLKVRRYGLGRLLALLALIAFLASVAVRMTSGVRRQSGV